MFISKNILVAKLNYHERKKREDKLGEKVENRGEPLSRPKYLNFINYYQLNC